MPTYQYACTDPECGNRFDLVQAFTDPAVTSCPVCTSPVRKVYGSVGVVFKGSGFYRNDSRNEGGGKSTGKDSAAGAKDGASTSKDAAASAKSDSAGSTSSSSSSSGSSTSSTPTTSTTPSGKAAASA